MGIIIEGHIYTNGYICPNYKYIAYSICYMTQQEMASILTRYKDALQFAQGLPPRPIYKVKEVAKCVHERTVRRRVKKLTEIGLAKYNRGQFTIKREVIAQPLIILEKLIPSFAAFMQARRFGKYYRQSDIDFMMKNLPKKSMITLDYSAHKMTKFQSAHDLYVYVDDVEKTVQFLKENNFREGTKGSIIILPKIGSFENLTERVFLDCVAKGGRSMMDAIAIQLKHRDKITIKARFTIDMLLKVQEDLSLESVH